MLLTEGEDMRNRLAALGKHVGGGLIPDVPHYWDHMVRTVEHRAKRDLFYGKAAREVREMLES
jgi:putative ergosteryl-3beta-O-L-aspartate hydrolase